MLPYRTGILPYIAHMPLQQHVQATLLGTAACTRPGLSSRRHYADQLAVQNATFANQLKQLYNVSGPTGTARKCLAPITASTRTRHRHWPLPVRPTGYSCQ